MKTIPLTALLAVSMFTTSATYADEPMFQLPPPPDLSGFTTTSAPTDLGKKIIADAKRQKVDDKVYVSFTVSGPECDIRSAEDSLGVVYLDVSGRTVDKATVYDGETGGIVKGVRADDIKRKVAEYDASHTDSTDSTG